MVKLQVLGNNSKTVNNIKNYQHSKIYVPCNFEVNPITHFGVIALFSSNFLNFNSFHPVFQNLLEINVKFKLQTCSACQFAFFHQIFNILILFLLYFNNYKRQMLSLNCKNVQHVKIYLPCNFEVNSSTYFGVITLFSSNFQHFITFRLIFQQL